MVKEADALTEKGYEVEVLGRGDLPGWLEQDTFLLKKRTWKFDPIFSRPSLPGKAVGKARRHFSHIVFRLFGLESPWQFGPMAAALLKEGRKRDAFLYIAHSEVGMWAAEQLRKEGKRVGVDMEDWFSEDLLPEARRERPIRLLKELEKNLLCHGVHSTCTSEAMADALVEAYGCRRPTVIRNVFPCKDREQLDGKWKDRPGMAKWMPRNDPEAARPKEAPVSIHWFSQTIGPGRGLETLFQALAGLEGNWELHLRGNLKGYEKWLERVCPASVKGKMKVHGLVENEELISRIAEHDIGYAGELGEPPSRNLTITNKFFQYLQAGLAVVASDTAGQKEVADQAAEGIKIFSFSDKTLKNQIAMMKEPSSLSAMKKNALQAYNSHFNWEKEKTKLKITP